MMMMMKRRRRRRIRPVLQTIVNRKIKYPFF
jgi:hypothetical protein